MKKLLSLFAAVSIISSMAAFGADEKKKQYKEDGCCAMAVAKGEKCAHPCCVKAEAKGEVCAKCNK